MVEALPIRHHLLEFDGRSLDTLHDAEIKFGHDPTYISKLIKLVSDEDENVSNGSTWLLKASLEKDGTFSESQTLDLLNYLPAIRSWGAQLHLCQSFQFLSFPKEPAQEFWDWLTPLTEHDRPFIRAWSVEALSRIRMQHNEFDPELRVILAKAQSDPSASVQARLRNIGKRLEGLEVPL